MAYKSELRAATGQTFWIGINGTSFDEDDTRKLMEEIQPGGIVLFQRNVKSIAQVQELNRSLQRYSPVPLFIAVDQEGGVVERLHEIIGYVPPAMALSATGNVKLTRDIHRIHARMLRSLGFNVNFNAVLDLALTGADNGLNTRCFSDDPRQVTRFARAMIEGHSMEGVLSCGKHFPGLGDTTLDSHLDLPEVKRPWKTILREDVVPYKNLIDDLPFIMVNHALYKDKDPDLPASLSPEVVEKFLKQDLGYKGFSVCDDLNMGAVANFRNLSDSIVMALRAGNHLALVCKPEGALEAFHHTLKAASEDPALERSILTNSVKILREKYQRLGSIKKRAFDRRDILRLQKLSQRAADLSLSTLYGERWSLPRKTRVSVFIPRTKWVSKSGTALAEVLRKKSTVKENIFAKDASAETLRDMAKRAADYNIVVVTNLEKNPAQQLLLDELMKSNKRIALINGAYPAAQIPAGMETAISAFWTAEPALRAAGKLLTGKLKERGSIPLKSEHR